MSRHLLPRVVIVAIAAAAAFVTAATSASAQDKLKIAAGQRGNWDSAVPELMQRLGIAKKHGLDLDIVWTQGAGETQQAVISNSVDVGVAPGVMGVLRAFSQGAPLRVIGNQAAVCAGSLLVCKGRQSDQVVGGYRG